MNDEPEVLPPTDKMRNDFAAFLRNTDADKLLSFKPAEWQEKMMQDFEDADSIEAEYKEEGGQGA